MKENESKNSGFVVRSFRIHTSISEEIDDLVEEYDVLYPTTSDFIRIAINNYLRSGHEHRVKRFEELSK